MTRRRRAAVAVLLGVAASLVVAMHGGNAQAPAPGVEFVAALQDARDALPSGDAVPRADARLQRVRARLQRAVALAPSSSALAPISADLERDPAGIADARIRLQALVNALALPPGSVAQDPGAAQSTLRDVYRQDAFSHLGATPPSDGWLSQIGRGITTALGWLAGHTVGALGAVPAAILAALVLAAIIAFALLRLRAAGTLAAHGAAVAEPRPQNLDADGEWQQAEAAARRGEHRQAVRHAFRSALLAAAQRGRLQVNATWTTTELLARAHADADLLALLAPAAASFDHAWYSGRPVTQADWEVARERCDAVRHLAGRRSGAIA